MADADDRDLKLPRRRVLVIEDDPSTRHALRLLFLHHKWDVMVAGSVKEGLDLARTAPECIVLDLMLPDGDGIKVLQFVRDQQLPSHVAVVSGSSDPDRLDRVRSLRPRRCLPSRSISPKS